MSHWYVMGMNFQADPKFHLYYNREPGLAVSGGDHLTRAEIQGGGQVPETEYLLDRLQPFLNMHGRPDLYTWGTIVTDSSRNFSA